MPAYPSRQPPVDYLEQERQRRSAHGLTVERYRTATADTDFRVTDHLLLVDTTAGNVTVTLPPVDRMLGRVITIKKIAAANTVTVDGDGANIDGAATLAWTAQYQSYDLLSDGTDWWIH